MGFFWRRSWKGEGSLLNGSNGSWILLKGVECVNVNGERSSYFRTYRGLRQGDPLSPLLFNLIADALGVMIEKVIQKNHIKGVLDDLIPRGSLTYCM
jgi:hypothetical protein